MFRLIQDRANHNFHVKNEAGDKMPLGEFVRSERVAQGMRVAELTRKAGIQHPSLRKLEMAQNNSLRTAFMALDVLGYKIIIVDKGRKL